MNIIENEYDEELVIAAEQLMHNNQLVNFKELSKNLWLFYFTDPNLEVEILVKSKQKSKFTCECGAFAKNKICKHVVASLIRLREIRSSKEKKKPEQRRTVSTGTKYTFKTILDQANKVDLQNFIQSYARKDKDFALAFKVHFASKTETGFENEKFKKLLDQAVKPKSARHPNFTRKEWHNFNFLLADFLAQIQDNISQDQLYDAYIIFEKCMDKIAYTKHIYEKDEEKDLMKLEEKYVAELNFLLKKDLAPEFKERITINSIENACKSYYFPEAINYISAINKVLGFSTEQKLELLSNFENKYQKAENKNNYLAPMMLELSFKNSELTSFIEARLNGLEMVQGLQKLKTSKRQEIIEYYLENSVLSTLEIEEKALLELEHLAFNEKYNVFIKQCLKLVKASNESKVLGLILKHLPEHKFKLRSKYMKSLIEKFSLRARSELFLHYKYYEELISILTNELDLALIVNFDHELMLNGYESRLFLIYKKAVKKYLDNHIGEPSREKIQYVFFHLNKIGASKLRVKLNHYIIEEYPHRYQSNKNALYRE